LAVKGFLSIDSDILSVEKLFRTTSLRFQGTWYVWVPEGGTYTCYYLFSRNIPFSLFRNWNLLTVAPSPGKNPFDDHANVDNKSLVVQGQRSCTSSWGNSVSGLSQDPRKRALTIPLPILLIGRWLHF